MGWSKQKLSEQFGLNKILLLYIATERTNSNLTNLWHSIYTKRKILRTELTLPWTDPSFSGWLLCWCITTVRSPSRIPSFNKLLELATLRERVDSLVQQRTHSHPSTASSPTLASLTSDSISQVTNRVDRLQLLLHIHIKTLALPFLLCYQHHNPHSSRSASPNCNYYGSLYPSWLQ